MDSLIYKFTFNSSGFQIGPTPAANITAEQNNSTFLNTASWSNREHLVRFGGEFDGIRLDKDFPQVFDGQLFFSLGNIGTPCALGCSDFQEFLLGASAFTYGGSGVSTHKYRIGDSALFVQDDYKVTSDLTLNLGLRWELNGAVHDDLCHIGNTNPALAMAGQDPFLYPACVNSLNVPGLTGTRGSTTLNNSYASDYGPRVGFAYNLFGESSTAIRGGYGISTAHTVSSSTTCTTSHSSKAHGDFLTRFSGVGSLVVSLLSNPAHRSRLSIRPPQPRTACWERALPQRQIWFWE